MRLLGIEFQYNEVSSLVMEHLDGVPLDKYILAYGNLNESKIKLYMKQIVSAINYMHSKLVMHR